MWIGRAKMFRTLAPWVTENPLMMHLIASDEASVKRAIDQCHEVGFEMLILSFGSGFNLESRNPEVLKKAQAFSATLPRKESRSEVIHCLPRDRSQRDRCGSSSGRETGLWEFTLLGYEWAISTSRDFNSFIARVFFGCWNTMAPILATPVRATTTQGTTS